MLVLSILLIIPLVGAAIITLMPATNPKLIRGVAVCHALIALIWSLGLWHWFDTASGTLQFSERFVWNHRLGTYYSLGIDGFSFPMVILTTLLCLIAMMASKSIDRGWKGYFSLMLLLETAILGVFMSQDWALFYLFWELTLVPLFFLIDRWGGPNRDSASINFVLYTMGGSVFMLMSLLVLFDTSSNHSFEMTSMAAGAGNLGSHKQLFIFLGFLIGFGVKIPLFPLHGWLPLAHVEAPSPVSILLSGVLLKMGAYGLIRAAMTLPKAMIILQPILATAAFIGLIYGGLLAWRQQDLKRMIAYSSVSHMGVVILGIAALNQTAMLGATLQMVAHGLVAGSMFLLVGLLYERTHTRDINHYSNLIRTTPRFALFITIAFLAAMGLPGTVGFIAELHTLIGGYERWGWIVVLLTMSVLISAAYSFRTVGRLFTGPERPDMHTIADLTPFELIATSLLIGSILLLGWFPTVVLNMMTASVTLFGATFPSMFQGGVP
ncbi:MAG: NADH-quinone oxidoreductase subunit M [Magnetococcales bacterium]|nr:NADH-quinone oxidoreductase subunit M [Magnetococcales bacterium]MBF0148481.1 NADH-quinone oxidoreductase subunit M [Magnetococcales bacterium]